MKIAIIVAIVTLFVVSEGRSFNDLSVCDRYSAAIRFVDILERNGTPISKIPISKLFFLKQAIQTGEAAGCYGPRPTPQVRTVVCKRFTGKGRSVLC